MNKEARPFEEYKEMIQDMSKDNMIKGLYDLSANIIAKDKEIERLNNIIKPDKVLLIRKERQNGKKCKELYKSYADRITFNGFEKIYYGITWKNLN